MLSDHFSEDEMRCPCGCGIYTVTQDLIAGLEDLRRYINQQIIVTSGHRCPGHDKAVGGSGSGPHTLGMAADIYSPNMSMADLWKAIEACQGGYWWGQGAYPDNGNFIHVDVSHIRYARWVQVKGKYIYLFQSGQSLT